MFSPEQVRLLLQGHADTLAVKVSDGGMKPGLGRNNAGRNRSSCRTGAQEGRR